MADRLNPYRAASEAAIRATYAEAVRAADRHREQDPGGSDHDYQRTIDRAAKDRDAALAALDAAYVDPTSIEAGDA